MALAIADVATYSALQSFLYQRIDQQLEQSHGLYENIVNRGGTIDGTLGCAGRPDSRSRRTRRRDGWDRNRTAGWRSQRPAGEGTTAVATPSRSRRSRSATPVADWSTRRAARPTSTARRTPRLPATITGFTTAPDGSRWPTSPLPSTKADGPTFRVRASTLDDGNLLIVAQPLGDIGSTLHHLLLIELAVTGGAVLVALLGGFWLVRIGLRPLRDMETAAESIAAGNLTERVPGENESTEVGRLARTLNVMLTRIESAFGARLASERRLRASEHGCAASWPTPPMSSAPRSPPSPPMPSCSGGAPPSRRRTSSGCMGGIRTETGRMEHLVADLLLLARLDEGRPMERRSVDLVALCAEAVHTASTVGPDWPVTFRRLGPSRSSGDATSLRQVIDNLLGNVRAHTPAGHPRQVAVEPEGDGAVITVADDGPGMEPEEAAHVFERFYRSDPSRSRVHGGAGLGLSIVSAIVADHGGTVSAEGRSGEGTTFTRAPPLAPPDSSRSRPTGSMGLARRLERTGHLECRSSTAAAGA